MGLGRVAVIMMAKIREQRAVTAPLHLAVECTSRSPQTRKGGRSFWPPVIAKRQPSPGMGKGGISKGGVVQWEVEAESLQT